MYFDEKDKTYVILDIEGNSAKSEEERKITQFSALVIKNGEISEVDLMNRNVNYINPYVRRMTHITVGKCKSMGCSERRMVDEIYKLLSDADTIYAYGCDFDRKILAFIFDKYHLKPIKTPIIDVIDDVKKYLTPSKLKLSIASHEYGFKTDFFHNALVDCYATYHLMKVIEELRGLY